MGFWGQTLVGQNSLGTMLVQGTWFQGLLNPGPGVLEAFVLVSQARPEYYCSWPACLDQHRLSWMAAAEDTAEHTRVTHSHSYSSPPACQKLPELQTFVCAAGCSVTNHQSYNGVSVSTSAGMGLVGFSAVPVCHEKCIRIRHLSQALLRIPLSTCVLL